MILDQVGKLFFPPEVEKEAQVDPQFERCKTFARMSGLALGLVAVIYAVVGYILGTVSMHAILASLLTASSMFAAVMTGGIGFVTLPVIILLGITAAAGGGFIHPGFPVGI